MDMTKAFEEVLLRTANNGALRPTALLLLGDQIYADDVAPHLSTWLMELGSRLMGGEEVLPDIGSISRVPFGSRGKVVRRLGLTSTESDFHLMSLGEFIAMYLVSWNPDMWPATLPSVDVISSGQKPSGYSRSQLLTIERQLLQAKQGSKALRRVMANVPTYMLFDDHEITDDWNFDGSWKGRVEKSRGGSAIVANGLCCYFAFQALGNAPENFRDGFIREVQGALVPRLEYSVLYRSLAHARSWSFATPTTPSVLFIDSRTQRANQYSSAMNDYQVLRISDTGEVRTRNVPRLVRTKLISEEIANACSRLLASTRGGSSLYAIVVTATPPFGLPLLDRLQRTFAAGGDEYDWDYESWHANPESIISLAEDVLLQNAIHGAFFLSGDLHFAYSASGMLSACGRTIAVGQMVTSALKNPFSAGGVIRRLESWFGEHSSMTSYYRSKSWRSDGSLLITSSNKFQPELEERVRSFFGDPQVEEILTFDSLYGSTRMTTDNNAGMIEASADGVTYNLLVPKGAGAMEGTRKRWAPAFSALRLMNSTHRDS